MPEYLSKLTFTPEFLKIFESAVGVMTEGVSIADARQPDMPLVFVNRAFTEMTGYSAAEIKGKNCRFLQGEATDMETVRTLREAINQHKRCTVQLINYRKNGEPFWNRLSIVPVFTTERDLSHYVGIQSDMGQVTDVSVMEERRQGMLATLATLSDRMTDYMVQLKYLRLQIAEKPSDVEEFLADFDHLYDQMTEDIDAIFSTRDYREVALAKGIQGIDLSQE